MGHSWRDSRGPAFLWHGLTKDSPNGPRAFVLTRTDEEQL
jgi:hypothetical protein